MLQIRNERLAEIDQCADIEALDTILRDNLTTDAKTIATHNLLFRLIPKDQMLEMRVKLVLVEVLACTLTDGAESLFTQTRDFMNEIRNIFIICQIALEIGSREKEGLLADSLQFSQHEQQLTWRINLSLFHSLLLHWLWGNIGFEGV